MSQHAPHSLSAMTGLLKLSHLPPCLTFLPFTIVVVVVVVTTIPAFVPITGAAVLLSLLHPSCHWQWHSLNISCYPLVIIIYVPIAVTTPTSTPASAIAISSTRLNVLLFPCCLHCCCHPCCCHFPQPFISFNSHNSDHEKSEYKREDCWESWYSFFWTSIS